jgi:hypothetical protein
MLMLLLLVGRSRASWACWTGPDHYYSRLDWPSPLSLSLGAAAAGAASRGVARRGRAPSERASGESAAREMFVPSKRHGTPQAPGCGFKWSVSVSTPGVGPGGAAIEIESFLSTKSSFLERDPQGEEEPKIFELCQAFCSPHSNTHIPLTSHIPQLSKDGPLHDQVQRGARCQRKSPLTLCGRFGFLSLSVGALLSLVSFPTEFTLHAAGSGVSARRPPRLHRGELMRLRRACDLRAVVARHHSIF